MTLTLEPAGTLTLLPDPEPAESRDDGELWYRDNSTHALWEPLDALRAAEDIIRSRSTRNPWAGIGRFSQISADGEAGQVHMLEVLGWDDRVYVCGDVSRVGSQWRWSSWPNPLPPSRTPTTVGPAWYQADVFKEQLVTVDNAITQLRPALHAIGSLGDQAPGFLWLPRELDADPNAHLRTPLTSD